MYCLFRVILCIVCVYMCTVLLPPGGYPIAVNKYIKYLLLHVIEQQIATYNSYRMIPLLFFFLEKSLISSE